MTKSDVEKVLADYPVFFWACHGKHVKDKKTGRGPSARQASVLDHLDAELPVHLRQLAGHMGVTASTMSLMIDRLERGGYVRRTRNDKKDGDKRQVNLWLTPAGQRIKGQQKVLDPDKVRAVLQRLAARDRKAVLTGLEILARAARGYLEERETA